MKETIRPAGSGKDGEATAFLRTLATPRAALVLSSSTELPSDWPTGAKTGSTDEELGHALGWTLEIQRNEIHLLNPLGEGSVKAPLPELAADWSHNVRQDGSCAVFLTPPRSDDDSALTSVDAAGRAGNVRAATVRAAFSEDFGKVEPVGRNQPCTCGSGKKYKHCCG